MATTLEDLYENIGGLGRFQIFELGVVSFSEILAGILTMLPVFVGAHPRIWTCTEINDFEYNIESISSSDPALCRCNGTLHGGKSSIVSEWDLVCEYAWVADFITSIQMVGMMLGSCFGSQIPDWFGRKKPFCLFCCMTLGIGMASGFTVSPAVYAAARFFIGLSIGCYTQINVVYLNEILPLNRRNLTNVLRSSAWAFGIMLLAPLAYWLESWQKLSWVSALPMTIVLIAYQILTESPQWLLESGRVQDAKEALDVVAHWNGFPPVAFSIVENLAFGSIDDILDGEKAHIEEKIRIGFKFKIECLKILKNSQQIRSILVFTFSWFSFGLIYFGIGFNTKNLDGNPYMNLIFMGLVEVIGFLTAIFALEWFGRQLILLGYFLASSLSLMGIIIMELNLGIDYSSSCVTSLALVAQFGISGGWTAIRIFTAEAFPSDVGSTAFDVCSIAASVGGIIAPQLVYIAPMFRTVPYFVFGAFSFMGITATLLLLDDTKGKNLERNE